MPNVQASGADGGSRHRRGRRIASSLAEINVVPLVDVMLVMLIIFMVTAPMMQRGIDVSLPVSRRADAISDERIFVTVPLSYLADGRVMIGDESIGLDVLAERIRQELITRTEKDVFIRTEGTLQVQDLFNVLDELQDGGVERLGVLTDPPTER